MATAKQQEVSEFGGVRGDDGLYDNVDPVVVARYTSKEGAPYPRADQLQPHQARMALTQTDPADPTSVPRFGDGGQQVQ